MTPLSPLTLAPPFSHVRISLGTPGQRSALVAYDSSLRIFVAGTASGHSHHFWSLEGFSRERPIPSTPAAVLASSHTNLRRSSKSFQELTDESRLRSCPLSVVQTPSLSWLRLHLSAHPLDVYVSSCSHFFAQSDLRTCSETLLCVLQASFESLACVLEGILQCVVLLALSSVSKCLGCHA